MTNDTDQIVDRLDRIAFLLTLAFRDRIEEARQAVLKDPVAAAILAATETEWVAAGELKSRIAASTNQSERTVSRRLSQLAIDGWLVVSGAGASVRYRSRGAA